MFCVRFANIENVNKKNKSFYHNRQKRTQDMVKFIVVLLLVGAVHVVLSQIRVINQMRSDPHRPNRIFLDCSSN
jgi:hypothetical protein